jgi:prolyl oligopeptidase
MSPSKPMRPHGLFAATLALVALVAQAQTNPPQTAAPSSPPPVTSMPKPNTPLAASQAEAPADPYLWLEDVAGEKALNWVRERNAATDAVLTARPEYSAIKQELKEVLNASDRIPYPSRIGGWFYNLWQDKNHKKGLWRRTTLEEYRKPEPKWETVIDLDALGKAEGQPWVWAGASCLAPNYQRCLVALSKGGSDATVVREFDLKAKRFVKSGFSLPEAKQQLDWIDANHAYVATDFGPGSLTDSGYPRIIKRWKRGTPLTQATTVFEGEKSDVSVSVMVDTTPGFERTTFTRATDFYNQKTFVLEGKALKPLDVPDDVSVSWLRDTLFISLRKDWAVAGTTFKAGSVLYADAKAYLQGQRQLQALFTPSATRSLSGMAFTRDHVLLSVLDNVSTRLEQWKRVGERFEGGALDAPQPGTVRVWALHDPHIKNDPLAEHYMLNYTGFLTPDTLFLGQTAQTRHAQREVLKARQAQFDAAGMRAEQRFATSKDGTRVPYFIVWGQGTDAARANGQAPTLLYGYGGFEVSLEPGYSGAVGRAWLRRGGVRVVANIRGGGEFGPQWHQSAILANKQRSYDDFIAVAQDLITSKVTTPRHLGIMGGSNGGLLVGATFTQRPDLFNAVVCQVPLLDMKRYHLLLAGASWMAEYGNPDKVEDWAVIGQYSPYQNLKAGVKYPRVLFTTSTRDDRVHPGHARKMVARMTELGAEPYYFENIEGGHGGAADNDQRAHLMALEYTYLWQQLGPNSP